MKKQLLALSAISVLGFSTSLEAETKKPATTPAPAAQTQESKPAKKKPTLENPDPDSKLQDDKDDDNWDD